VSVRQLKSSTTAEGKPKTNAAKKTKKEAREIYASLDCIPQGYFDQKTLQWRPQGKDFLGNAVARDAAVG
jgi:hypothetical protein